MGKAEKGNSEGSGYGTSVRYLVILVLLALPYFLWPLKISRKSEDAESVANASVRTPPPVQEPDVASPFDQRLGDRHRVGSSDQGEPHQPPLSFRDNRSRGLA